MGVCAWPCSLSPSTGSPEIRFVSLSQSKSETRQTGLRTVSSLTHLETQRNLYEASFLALWKKRERERENTNCSSSRSHNKGFPKRPILINSIFSLTHKHPVYHQTLKRPLICNFFFFFFFFPFAWIGSFSRQREHRSLLLHFVLMGA